MATLSSSPQSSSSLKRHLGPGLLNTDSTWEFDVRTEQGRVTCRCRVMRSSGELLQTCLLFRKQPESHMERTWQVLRWRDLPTCMWLQGTSQHRESRRPAAIRNIDVQERFCEEPAREAAEKLVVEEAPSSTRVSPRASSKWLVSAVADLSFVLLGHGVAARDVELFFCVLAELVETFDEFWTSFDRCVDWRCSWLVLEWRCSGVFCRLIVFQSVFTSSSLRYCVNSVQTSHQQCHALHLSTHPIGHLLQHNTNM